MTVWAQVFDESTNKSFRNWINSDTLGIRLYEGDDFIEGFAFYYPQIFLLLFVLVHV